VLHSTQLSLGCSQVVPTIRLGCTREMLIKIIILEMSRFIHCNTLYVCAFKSALTQIKQKLMQVNDQIMDVDEPRQHNALDN
jgi:hypothetical protein